MKPCTESEASAYIDKANAWLCTSSGKMFGDCKSTARSIYAEALANADGKTVFSIKSSKK